MMMNLMFMFFLSLFSLINAIPITTEKRDVFVPPVLYPHAGTVWNVGNVHNVTWDTSGAPTSISNGAMILLRKGDLELPLILAENFDLRSGRTEVTVPWVTPDSDYSVVLFGDSGNWSANFTIQGTLA